MAHRCERLCSASQLWLPHPALCVVPPECFRGLRVWSGAVGSKSGKLRNIADHDSRSILVILIPCSLWKDNPNFFLPWTSKILLNTIWIFFSYFLFFYLLVLNMVFPSHIVMISSPGDKMALQASRLGLTHEAGHSVTRSTTWSQEWNGGIMIEILAKGK